MGTAPATATDFYLSGKFGIEGCCGLAQLIAGGSLKGAYSVNRKALPSSPVVPNSFDVLLLDSKVV